MGFYFSLICGILTGVCLVFLHRWFMNKRKSERSARAVDIALLSRIKLPEVQRICKDNFPSWVSFPEYERTKWINGQLKEIWPYVNKAASRVIKESVEPLLERYRPIGVSSIMFEKFTLGDVAPQIGGIKIHKHGASQVILDLELKWGGDPSIVLGISTMVLSLPVQLQDLKFFATLRIILELTGRIPCIGAVVVSLLSKPQPIVGYNLKAVGGSLTAMPGLQGIIEEIVKGALEDSIVWPKRIVVPLIPGYDTGHLVLKIQGKITVLVVKANGLKNVDLVGKSDPYVVLWTRALYKVKTQIIDDDLNPVWNETFELDVEEFQSTKVILKVKDQGMLMDADLGKAEFFVNVLTPEVWSEHTLWLLPEQPDGIPPTKSHGIGSITIRVFYHPYTKEEQEFVMEREKELKEAKKAGKVQPGETGGASQMATEVVQGTSKIVGTAGGAVGGAAKAAVGGLSGAAKMGIAGVGALGKTGLAGVGAVSKVFKNGAPSTSRVSIDKAAINSRVSIDSPRNR